MTQEKNARKISPKTLEHITGGYDHKDMQGYLAHEYGTDSPQYLHYCEENGFDPTNPDAEKERIHHSPLWNYVGSRFFWFIIKKLKIISEFVVVNPNLT